MRCVWDSSRKKKSKLQSIHKVIDDAAWLWGCQNHFNLGGPRSNMHAPSFGLSLCIGEWLMKDKLPVYTTRFIKQSYDQRIFVAAAINNKRSQEVERLGWPRPQDSCKAVKNRCNTAMDTAVLCTGSINCLKKKRQTRQIWCRRCV